MMLSQNKLAIAFCGASGTGKTTLAKMVAEEFNLEMNPVGSRSVAQSMGFDNPYDVDAAGMRSEFQRNLIRHKIEWERMLHRFTTDRTTLDQLCYTIMHDVKTASSQDYYNLALEHIHSYTHVFFTPISAFHSFENDECRVQDKNYHDIYETMLLSFLKKTDTLFHPITKNSIDLRFQQVKKVLDHLK